jgi:hypothetical protein
MDQEAEIKHLKEQVRLMSLRLDQITRGREYDAQVQGLNQQTIQDFDKVNRTAGPILAKMREDIEQNSRDLSELRESVQRLLDAFIIAFPKTGPNLRLEKKA